MGDREQAADKPIKSTAAIFSNAAFSRALKQVVDHSGDDTAILGKTTKEHYLNGCPKEDDTDVKEVDCHSIKEFNNTEQESSTSLQDVHQECVTLEQTSSKRMPKTCKGSLALKPRVVPVRVSKKVNTPVTIKTSQDDRCKSESDYTDMVDAQLEGKQDEDGTDSVSSVEFKSMKVKPSGTNGFSFKCDERAEKRKQFYTKLVEIHTAKEKEKNQIQAKTKEEMEAEIKQLRKSLTFKAIPMPTFYREGAPPKVELRKIPTTRAKSPKLGRQSRSMGASSTENFTEFEEESEEKADELGNSNKTHLKSSHIPAKKDTELTTSEEDSLGTTFSYVNEVNGHPKGITMEMEDVNLAQTFPAPDTEIAKSMTSKNGKSPRKEDTHDASGAKTLMKERTKALTSLRKGTHTLKPVIKKEAALTTVVSANVAVQS
eukprot:c36495_g1_i1 orf=468-1757(-)